MKPCALGIAGCCVAAPQSCRLVAVADGHVVGSAGLHLASSSLRRSHVRGLGIGIAASYQGRGVGRLLITRLLDWADNWAGVLRVELTARRQRSGHRALPGNGIRGRRPAHRVRAQRRPLRRRAVHGAAASAAARAELIA